MEWITTRILNNTSYSNFHKTKEGCTKILQLHVSAKTVPKLGNPTNNSLWTPAHHLHQKIQTCILRNIFKITFYSIVTHQINFDRCNDYMHLRCSLISLMLTKNWVKKLYLTLVKSSFTFRSRNICRFSNYSCPDLVWNFLAKSFCRLLLDLSFHRSTKYIAKINSRPHTDFRFKIVVLNWVTPSKWEVESNGIRNKRSCFDRSKQELSCSYWWRREWWTLLTS